ncbi:pheromone-regulated protein prm10 [Paramarasmius palmivorus]|uniref:Pheromone-regulated protein prm10 n=1 Tax=Paramarasmius palmivorus TaxID=297713 RepID=A0AAW0E4P6_9AGAR
MSIPPSHNAPNPDRRISNADNENSSYFTQPRSSNADLSPAFRRADSDLENAGASREPPGSSSNSFARLSGVEQVFRQGDDGLRKGSDSTLVGEERRAKLSKRLSFASLASGISHTPVLSALHRSHRPSGITRNVEDVTQRRKFLLKLAKALLTFGAPSHRIQSQLSAASNILGADAGGSIS